MGKKHKMSSSRFLSKALNVCRSIYGWKDGEAVINAAINDGNYYPIENAIKKEMTKAYSRTDAGQSLWIRPRIISDHERNVRYRYLVGLLGETRRRARLYGK